MRDPHGQGVTNYANYQNQDKNVPMGNDSCHQSQQRRSESEEGMQVPIFRIAMKIAMIKEEGMGNDRSMIETAAQIVTMITTPTTNDREGPRRNGLGDW